MRRINPLNKKISFTFEECEISCNDGETVASALLASGEIIFRKTTQSSSGRGPYCMMGVCFDCLIEIDGWPNRQACMVVAKNGMRVNRQVGPAKLILSRDTDGEKK